ncbi:MAG: putative O-glycosylation ligase, exosortase A system-associated [Burkholderiaceae bacterium]|nr:putative O-glycosylation ligase, exosortase A system-associated [Burkholderiaceae bacterium]
MRDILLTLILAGLLPVSLRRPFIGALVFAVVSLANPHRLTWGFAYGQPWAQMYALATLAGILFTRERIVGDSIRRYLPVLVYLAWMGVTTAYAFDHPSAMFRWQQNIKTQLMCLVTLMLLTDWERVKQLVWVAVCSIGFYGLKGGIFTITTGGEDRVWGPPDSAIQDNNHLAVGLVMMLPLMYWLFTQTQKKWLRALIVFSALMTATAIFGSHSRSAFLGIGAISIFLLLKSHHKFSVGLVAIIAGAMLASFMPEDYWERMETIRTYQEDASAMGRINVWHTAVAIANDRITGGGFEYYSPEVFARYAPNPEDVHASHSIYFQALGEHGWIGFAIFMFIWAYTWSRCRRIIRLADDSDDGRAQASLARMIQVSMVGFAVGGAFVNIGNWDMDYYLMISALATARIVERQAADRKALAARERAAARPAAFGRPASRVG